MSEHKQVKRVCPGCGVEKTYDARHKGCSPACGAKLRGASVPVAATEPLPVAEEHALRKENKRLRAELQDALAQIANDQKYGDFVAGILAQPVPDAPAWTRKVKGGREAMPTAFLSDTHFGEVVHPEQIEWLNGYNREIAEARLKRFFHSTVALAKDYLAGVSYPGIVMPMGGDMFSGDIHEELAKTNAGPIQEEVLYWLEPMMAGITLLADEFGKVHIPCVVGNHPRGTMKPSHKMRVPNNFDWLFAHLLAKFLKHDTRITFQISDSADCLYQVYNTRYNLTHGDQFKGGSGIAGALSPLMIGDARKRKRAQRTNRNYDWMLAGHWHQRMKFKGLLVNSSIKGYDEYCYHNNFDFDVPTQSFWLTDPDHGMTIDAPIFVQGKDEPWMKHSPCIVKAA